MKCNERLFIYLLKYVLSDTALSPTLLVVVVVVAAVVESQFLVFDNHGKHPMFYYHLVLFLSSRVD